MAAATGVFGKWLEDKLKLINEDVDLDVFPSYVMSILEDEDCEEEEQKEAITDFLSPLSVGIFIQNF